MFATAYIKHAREDGADKNKWKTKSLKCILVGKCPYSDSLQFFHPPSKQIISGANGYHLNTFSPGGPQFEERYDGNFIFNTKTDEYHYHLVPTHEQGDTKYMKKGESLIPVKILNAPVNPNTDSYVVQGLDTGNIMEVSHEDIEDSNPQNVPEKYTTRAILPHIPWVKQHANATLYLQGIMAEPKQGRLVEAE